MVRNRPKNRIGSGQTWRNMEKSDRHEASAGSGQLEFEFPLTHIESIGIYLKAKKFQICKKLHLVGCKMLPEIQCHLFHF